MIDMAWSLRSILLVLVGFAGVTTTLSFSLTTAERNPNLRPGGILNFRRNGGIRLSNTNPRDRHTRTESISVAIPSPSDDQILWRSSTALPSTASPSSSPSSSSDTSATSIVYQKVVRPSQKLPDILFLGYLIEYIESKYKIPDRLPMVYEALYPPETENDDGTSSNDGRWIVAWDSPLSPSADATRMEVEVVGIYTDKSIASSGDGTKGSSPSVPNMAMVVVKKKKAPTGDGGIPAMMEQLFKDSEKQILKALDKGLDDFVAGKIKFEEEPEKKKMMPSIPNVKSVKEVLDAEIVEEEKNDNHDKTEQEPLKAKKEINKSQIDRESIKTKKSMDKKALEAKIAAAKASMKVPESPPKPKKPIPSAPRNDFALEAVKQKLREKSNSSTPPPVEDFAVAAAKEVARKVHDSPQTSFSDTTISDKQVAKNHNSKNVEEQAPALGGLDKSFRPDDYMGNKRAFTATFSRVPGRVSKTKGSISFHGKAPVKAAPVAAPKFSNEASPTKDSATTDQIKNKTKASLKTKRNLNTRVVDDSVDNILNDGLSNSPSPPDQKENTKTQRDIEMDIMKITSEVMDDLASQGQDMSPEELLRDVLKFDDEQSKNNAPGAGFVSGAFEKAKDLLKQQKEQRAQQSIGFKDISGDQLGFDTNAIASESSGDLTPEEELKRIFEAGEGIADRQIAKYVQEDLGLEDEDGEVDELLRKEKDVSSYARVLDDELVELEVRINKSPDEEFDGSRKNPMFDVFSGPEVYNPNVDPETINFPGALPGTKEVKLPKELKEATLQAEFALDVLKRMQPIETMGKDGTVLKTEYFLGKKQLSQEQVDGLRRVVVEASQVGLIDDPLTLMAEQSRLQILIDELWEQPEERFQEIADNYRDLLLSENFVSIMRERLNEMAERDLDALRRDDDSLESKHAKERQILGQLVSFAQLLLKQARALGAELESQQLEVIRSICQVAMDPQHQTEEETSMALSDAVRDMRPLLDDSFVAYLKYAVAEEEARLARAGLLDDPEHNQWLFVLKIVQQGVHAEIAKGINRYIEHIWYVLRMDSQKERRMLLEKLIDTMPTLDVRPFVQVVDNIVGALGDSRRGEFDGATEIGEMSNKILQLYRDVHELLPPERIALKSQVADEWAEKQRKRLMEQRKVTTQRLQAARETEHLQGRIDEMVGSGEIERIE